MAMKINAGVKGTSDEYGRADVFFIDPRFILEGVNGRWQEHTDDDILSMVRSYEEDGGQIEPVEVRRVQDNKVMLTLGFRRWKAAIKYNELHPDKPMRLKCVVTTSSPEEAFIRNIVENRERRDTSYVDDAFNQRVLREQHGWKDSQIAAKYRCDVGLVGKLSKLPGLRREILLMVHTRELPLDLAVDLCALDESEQDGILRVYHQAEREGKESSSTPVVDTQEGEDGSGNEGQEGLDTSDPLSDVFTASPGHPERPDGSPVVSGDPTAPPIIVSVPGQRGKGQGRTPSTPLGNPSPAPPASPVPSTNGTGKGGRGSGGKGGKKKGRKKKAGVAAVRNNVRTALIEKGKGKPRSLSEVREFFESLTGPAEALQIRSFAESVVEFIQGKISDEKFRSAIEELVTAPVS